MNRDRNLIVLAPHRLVDQDLRLVYKNGHLLDMDSGLVNLYGY